MTVGSAPIARLGPVRIARFTTGDDPAYGVVSGDLDEHGQPADDTVVVELSGDPLMPASSPRRPSTGCPTSGCSHA
jgi:hypothetical protein